MCLLHIPAHLEQMPNTAQEQEVFLVVRHHDGLSVEVGEGRHLPGSTMEETSGFVSTDQGRVVSFWFGPDQETGRPALARWRAEPSEDWWSKLPKYPRAQ